ncbi:MAG: hypothetical protein ACREV2_18795 [Burkholderiales bacterium]
MLLLVTILKALNEVALYALLGQGILYVFAGRRRDQNFVYNLLKAITSPAMKIARAIAPRFVVDQHIPFLTLFIVLVLEFALSITQRNLCAQISFASNVCAKFVLGT